MSELFLCIFVSSRQFWTTAGKVIENPPYGRASFLQSAIEARSHVDSAVFSAHLSTTIHVYSPAALVKLTWAFWGIHWISNWTQIHQQSGIWLVLAKLNGLNLADRVIMFELPICHIHHLIWPDSWRWMGGSHLLCLCLHLMLSSYESSPQAV